MMKHKLFSFRKTLMTLACMLFSFFVIAQKGTVEGVVSDAQGGLIGATILVKGTFTGTVTDVDGSYSLTLAPGNYVLEASYTGYGALTQAVTVEGGKTVTANFTLKEGYNIDEVVILGSRSEPRTQMETAVPVDVISAKAINNSSYGNVTHVLQYMAPSFHSTPQTISDGTDHVDPATLRGLGPDQVLVLVNGKRRHTSSLINVNGTVGRGTVGTDLNAIPASAIKKIEILRDGAAAQYGSDAIAGVINIVLKDDRETASVYARTGITSEGDGEEVQAGANFGFGLGKKGYVNVTTDILSRGSTNRSGDYTGSVFGDSITIDGKVYSDNNASDLNAFYAQTPFDGKKVMEIGNSALRNVGTMLNAAYPISDNAELYGNLLFNYRNGEARGFYRFPSQRDRVVPELHPFGFSPIINSDITDNAFTVGLRGNLGEWRMDMSQTRGGNRFDFTINNSNNASLGTKSPTSAYAGGFEYSQNTSNVDFTRKYDIGVPLNVGFGGEFRLENYKIFEGEEASWVAGGATNSNGAAGSAGIQVFPGFQPQNALDKNRNNIGVYMDLEADLSEAFLLGMAGRYENYSDFGENFSYKLSARYKVMENLSLRAAYSTGFRAPSLHQLYFNNLSTQFVSTPNGLEPVQVGTFNNASTVTKGFGILPLEPEISKNLSAGFTARIGDLSLTVDGYNIDIDDRIVLSGRFSSGFENILQPLGAGAAQFFTNAVNTTTKGVDIVAQYRLWFSDNTSLNFMLAGNLTETEVDRQNGNPVIKTSDVLKGQETTLFNREEVSRLEVAQPKNKFAFSATLETGKLSVLLRATRFGEVQYIHPSDGDPSKWVLNTFTGKVETRDQTFSPKIVPDVEVAYSFSDHFKWTIGVHNFTNTYPDKHTHSDNNSSNRFVYSRRVMQFGVRGMFAYTKFTVNF